MRATFGRIALVALLSITLCGCKGGSSMFAWGKKKPSDSMSEAPKFAGSPALPSAGQTPGTAPTNVNGTVAAGIPSYGSVNNPSTNSAYGNQPAAYQQSVYPTTPYQATTIGQSSAAAPTANYGATNPAPTAYGNQASASVQPQQGQYNPVYGGDNVAAAQPYAAAPTNSSYGSAASPPAATTPTPPPAEYRMADSRGAANAGVPNSTPPAAPPANNAYGADRYAHLNDPASTPNSNPAASAAIAPTNVNPAPPGTGGYENYNLPPSNSLPSAPINPAPNSAYGPTGDTTAPPATNNGGSAIPARPDPNWRPGGTSSFSPKPNLLRPGSGENPQESAAPGRVMPVSYEAATNTTATPNSTSSATTPATTNANTIEAYGAYQGSATTSPPSNANSNAAAPQSGLFNGHSW